MKKLFTLFLGLFLAASFAQAQEYWNQYLINENFNGWVSLPTGWSTPVLSGTGATVGDSIRYNAGSYSGNRGGALLFPLQLDSTLINANFDVFVVSGGISRNNAIGFYLTGVNSTNFGTTGAFTDLIACVYLAGNSGKFHIWNMDIKGPVPVTKLISPIG